MRIFLTGGTGYIGRALAERLVSEGHRVCALVRPTSNAELLTRHGVVTVVGDLRDRPSMREGMAGSDWVIHAAAELDLTAPAARMRGTNVEGSDNVASLASKLGVGRLLAISSMAVFGGSPEDGSRATEESPARTPLPTRYAQTKHEADATIRSWQRRGLKVNTVYPSMVYGPPGKKDGANFFIRQVLRGRMPAMLGADRLISWIFLADLVDGIVRLMGSAPPGRDYLMTGDVTTVRSLVERVARLGGVRAPRLTLPIGLARVLLTLGTPLFRLRGRRPPIAADQLRNLSRHWAFDDRRAQSELGWSPRSLDAGLPPTIAIILGT
jgi:nucleoside-diphosphate-sugar epimerase